jgi:hypothetical protein
MSSIRASSMLHPKAQAYNPSTGLRHHLGNSLEVTLPHVRESKRDGSCRNRASCKTQIRSMHCNNDCSYTHTMYVITQHARARDKLIGQSIRLSFSICCTLAKKGPWAVHLTLDLNFYHAIYRNT